MNQKHIIKGRVLSFDNVAPHVRSIVILPQASLAFKAGQYAQLKFDGFEARPFSIASAPHAPHLEFHIKSIGHGASAYAAEQLKPGETVEITGPFGDAYLRPENAPILAVAGGLGIAPLKSIIDSALHSGRAAPIHLYMGGKHADDLYLENYFTGISKKHPSLKIIPVLSEPSGHDHHRTGYVGRVAAEDFKDLSGFHAYLAGPPPMILDTLPLLLGKGIKREHIYSDAL